MGTTFFTPEHKLKLSIARRKRVITEETKIKTSLSLKGKKKSLETRKKMSDAQPKGKDSPLWRGGKTPEILSLRNSTKYKVWRDSVFARDNYTCQFCGVRGGTLNADHIKSFALHPEFRFETDNGRTLCVECHKTTDTFARRNNQLNNGKVYDGRKTT